MKKTMIVIAVALMFAACNSGESTTTSTVDSTAVDSVAADSVKVDTSAVK